MTSLLYAMPGNEKLAEELAATLDFELGLIESRRFPDGEAYVRLATNPNRPPIAIHSTLDRPDHNLMPLIFWSGTGRAVRR
jgi:ribose-phosphate pyrophosphokinase